MSELNNIKFKKLTTNAVVPTKAHPEDAGFDMTAISVVETEDYIEYDTGIAMEIPTNHVGLLFPRSSISKYDLTMCNAVGVVDSNFRNSIRFRFKKIINHNKLHFQILSRIGNWVNRLIGVDSVEEIYPVYNFKDYKVGDKIGQIIIMPYPEIQFTEVSELTNTDRGLNGFGSTDEIKPKRRGRKRKNK